MPLRTVAPEDQPLVDAFSTAKMSVNGGPVESAAWWWLSFADPGRPEGDQFLGACLVRACGPWLAYSAASQTGLNPGGEMRAVGPLDDIPPGWPTWALLSRHEIDALDAAIDPSY